MSAALDDNFFRYAYGALVAAIARRVGMAHLERVEDGVQQALLAAVETWPRSGVPANPTGWLYRVAYNRVLDELRGTSRRAALLAAAPEEDPVEQPAPTDLLRLVFLCCDDALAVDASIVVALKLVCGFDVGEIAERLFLPEATVYKRLSRARARLRTSELSAETLADGLPETLSVRLPAVHTVLYVMFTEGHLSTDGASPVRRELCDEALRLTLLLADHPWGASPVTSALAALMHLQRARSAGRQDASGGLVLLEDQDRSTWDRDEIARGLAWLARSAEGDVFSRYHAEAGIAAEHCLAPSFAETRWDRIVACYAQLEAAAPSPLHTLNRALALAEWRGPAAGLELVEGQAPPTWLAGSYMWTAVLADLNRRSGRHEQAARFREQALETAPSPQVRAALERRLR